MDLRLRVITPGAFDIPNCDPHLVEFSSDLKYVTIRGDVIIGREGQLRINAKYDHVSRQHCLLKVHGTGWFGMKKRWTIISLSDNDTAIWGGGVIFRINRNGIKGDIRDADEERRRRGLRLQDTRFEQMDLVPGMGIMITTDMKANLMVE